MSATEQSRNSSQPVMNATIPSTTDTTTIATTATTADPCPWSSTDLECVQKRLWEIVAPVIILVGIVGNLVVIVVFSRLHFSRSSTLLHMFVLAITDIVILSIGPMRYWIIDTFGYDVRLLSNAGCKVDLFLLYTSLDFSAWILVSVTVERTLCVLKPLHVRGWFNVRRTLLRLLVIFLLLCCLNGHYFFSNGLVELPAAMALTPAGVGLSSNETVGFSSNDTVSFLNGKTVSSSNNKTVYVSRNETVCTSCNETRNHTMNSTNVTSKNQVEYDCDSLTPKWEYFEEYQFVYIDLCFDSVIPFLTMVVCNSVIIVSLKKAGKHRPRHSTRREISGNKTSSHICHDDQTLVSMPKPSSITPREDAVMIDQTLIEDALETGAAKSHPNAAASFHQTVENSAASHMTISGESEAEHSSSRNNIHHNGTSPMSKSDADLKSGKRRISDKRKRSVIIEPTPHSIDRPRDTSLKRKIKKPGKRIISQRKPSNHLQSQDSRPRDHDPTNQDAAISSGVTRMLILVTSVFLVTTLPSALYFIVDSYVRDKDVDMSRTNSILDLTQAVTNLLQYANYGCNFLLYSARSKRFRQEIRYMLGLANKRFNRRRFRSSVLSGETAHSTHRARATQSGTDHRHSSSSRLSSVTESQQEDFTQISFPLNTLKPVSPSGRQRNSRFENGHGNGHQSTIPNTLHSDSQSVSQIKSGSADGQGNGHLSTVFSRNDVVMVPDAASGNGMSTTILSRHDVKKVQVVDPASVTPNNSDSIDGQVKDHDHSTQKGISSVEEHMNYLSLTEGSVNDVEMVPVTADASKSNKREAFDVEIGGRQLGDSNAHAPEATLFSVSKKKAEARAGTGHEKNKRCSVPPTKRPKRRMHRTDNKESLILSKSESVLRRGRGQYNLGFEKTTDFLQPETYTVFIEGMLGPQNGAIHANHARHESTEMSDLPGVSFNRETCPHCVACRGKIVAGNCGKTNAFQKQDPENWGYICVRL